MKTWTNPTIEELKIELTAAFREAVSRAASLHEPLYFSVFPHRFVTQGGTRNRLDNVAYQGASAGVRYLIPFVDHRVMDFAFRSP